MTKKLLSSVCGLCLLLLASISVRAGAQTVAAGPYYATPAWDQTIQCTGAASCPRFVVLSNMNSDAVLDRETGLVWEKSPSVSNLTFAQADGACNTRQLGNRQGWRLPTIHEIRTLMDPSRTDPALPDGHPFLNVGSSSTPSVWYWSSTAAVDFGILGVTFFSANATVTINAAGGAVARPWCVRGPGNSR